MTNQELIANLDIDQKTGKISFEQWWAMKSAVEKLVMDSVKIDAGELETGYTEAEENCRGCMGPCGVCEGSEVEKVVKWAHGIADSLSKNKSFSEEEQEVFANVRDGVIRGVMDGLGSCKACAEIERRVRERLEKEMDAQCRAGQEKIMQLERVVRSGVEMRSAQNGYFRTRTGENLDLARKLEREFDQMATKQLGTDEVTVVKGYGEMPTLFPA